MTQKYYTVTELLQKLANTMGELEKQNSKLSRDSSSTFMQSYAYGQRDAYRSVKELLTENISKIWDGDLVIVENTGQLKSRRTVARKPASARKIRR